MPAVRLPPEIVWRLVLPVAIIRPPPARVSVLPPRATVALPLTFRLRLLTVALPVSVAPAVIRTFCVGFEPAASVVES